MLRKKRPTGVSGSRQKSVISTAFGCDAEAGKRLSACQTGEKPAAAAPRAVRLSGEGEGPFAAAKGYEVVIGFCERLEHRFLQKKSLARKGEG
ncbi:hypothetical protein ACNHKD_02240 [Methylocystis sp. JAN1]|uniref:hypothetical protein n=1 Tax=Methylocystis sp. JAN1 TaxID=3397211 RepID=UPI003FA24967